MTDIAPIAAKLGRFLRLLSSDQDGEVVAAARALVRTLKGAGQDIHALAAAIERPSGGKLSKAEMKILYDHGYADGFRDGENKEHNGADFKNVGGKSWHEIAMWCNDRAGELSASEEQFVHDMAARSVWREPTEKQAKWLKSICLRLGGKV